MNPLYWLICLENDKYGTTKTAQLRGSKSEYGPQLLFNGQIEDSSYNGNWVTKGGLKYPWFEVKFTETIFIAGLEIRAFGKEVNGLTDYLGND